MTFQAPNLFLFLLFLGTWTTNVFAYPIAPRPLRTLVLESQYIIVGYVANSHAKPGTFNPENGNLTPPLTIARIVVLENLQGQIGKDTIEVVFQPNMDCPSPDIYHDNTYVVSFLDKNEKDGKFRTHAFSYGVKTLEKPELEIYKQRIAEIQEILKIQNAEKQMTETVEWLVKCAENETTRWEGSYELIIESKRRSHISSDNELTNYGSRLSPSQIDRLKTALLNTTREVDFNLVDIVYESNPAQIDDFLIKKLKTLSEDDFWAFEDFFLRLGHKKDAPEMKSWSKKINDYQEQIEADIKRWEELSNTKE